MSIKKIIQKSFRAMFGSSNERMLRQLQPYVDKINALEPAIAALSDTELTAKTVEFRARLKNKETLDDILPEAFAVIREAAKRVLNMRHFDVQLLGGIVLHRGLIAEMKTGEGKTLVATLAVYLNALPGKGVHVVTVNDYLAKRDSEQMGRLYNFLGLTTGCITNELSDAERKAAYAADITYGTNNEFGFDYLRDNMKFHLGETVQREFNYAIVDEVDSILVDEARTPLIISGPLEDAAEHYKSINTLVAQLQPVTDYEKEEKHRQVHLTDAGSEKIEQLLKDGGMITQGALYDYENIYLMHYVQQLLKAHALFSRDTDYIVKNGKVMIIDEFTGRMLEGRRFSDGLHQALEAKEGVKIQTENQTLASITFQNYFRMYNKLAGMTGTAATEATEFAEIYKLEVVSIPTNVPCIRKDLDDEVYRNSKDKYNAVIALIEDCYKRKQPALVGTVSIEKSETISELLKKKKIPHQVLNARHHEQEAAIIMDAGVPGSVTVATNMAGRGTDIKLGGNYEMHLKQEIQNIEDPAKIKEIADRLHQKYLEQKRIAAEAGGLYVIGTERHESRRIDDQLRGRAGRQGEPGASKFFVALDDDLMRIFGSQRLSSMLEKLGMTEGESLEHPWISRALAKAQQKVEAHNYDIRKQVLRYDDVMNEQRKFIYQQRREIMLSDNVDDIIENMRRAVVSNMVTQAIPENSYPDQWNVQLLQEQALQITGQNLPIRQWCEEEGIADKEIEQRLEQRVIDIIAKKQQLYGTELMQHLQRTTLLRTFDQEWIQLYNRLQRLRHGIHLRSYGQRDPLNEFKTESFNLFNEMIDMIRVKVIEAICKFEIKLDEHLLGELAKNQGAIEDELAAQMGFRDHIPTQITQEDEVPLDTPRNAPCPCGSGEKYKRCHGKLIS